MDDQHKPAKKVITYDTKTGEENGYLIEINKENDLTKVYMTVAYPKCFKGYHLHRVREANYMCIKGRIKIILCMPDGYKTFILDSSKPTTLNIPVNVPTGLWNDSESEDAWIINCPNPPYDPKLKNEQVDYTQEEIEEHYVLGIVLET